MNFVRSLFAILCLSLGMIVAVQADDTAELPGDSIYRVQATLTDSQGQSLKFSDAAGHVRLATMFYARCKFVCPMLIEQVRSVEAQLTPDERARLRVLLVSIDPERDTPEALAELAKQRKVDLARWTLTQPAVADLRKISAVLGVQYRQLDDGEFNHSSLISLIDPQGRVLAKSSVLVGAPDPEFVAAVRKALAATRH
ncbi:MAG TPA: SCO family protein [Chiayiivirga sp.]|nr:SCO family protein [Chiayiivirga sp.]